MAAVHNTFRIKLIYSQQLMSQTAVGFPVQPAIILSTHNKATDMTVKNYVYQTHNYSSFKIHGLNKNSWLAKQVKCAYFWNPHCRNDGSMEQMRTLWREGPLEGGGMYPERFEQFLISQADR